MAHLKRRMVHPDLFADPDFQPPAKALLFVGAMSIAEDSGCLPWRADLLRGMALPFSDITADHVQRYMDGFVDEGRAWTYERQGRTYAYLPDFPSWQGKLIRWNAPDTTPLPAGIIFEAYDAKERNGSGVYTWPTSREALDPKEALDLKDVNQEKEVLDFKEPAPPEHRSSGATSESKGHGRKEQDDLGAIEELLKVSLDSSERTVWRALIEDHGLKAVYDAAYLIEAEHRGSTTLPRVKRKLLTPKVAGQ